LKKSNIKRIKMSGRAGPARQNLARPARKKRLLDRATRFEACFDDHLKKGLTWQKKQTQKTFSKNLSQIRIANPRKPPTNCMKNIFFIKKVYSWLSQTQKVFCKTDLIFRFPIPKNLWSNSIRNNFFYERRPLLTKKRN